MKNLKTQGFILLDVDVVALNNAGRNTSSNFDNAVATKRIRKNGRTYVYVSGQAWRYWWRDSLQKNLNWELSPVTRDSKIAFTEADPIKYADDDVFGYMKAAKEVKIDKDGNPVLDKKGKEKTENVTVTRISPLKNSAIVSVASVNPEENWSSMARQEGDSVPYGKHEYSAIMKGMFSLDLAQVGTFSNYNKSGYVNLSARLRKEAIDSGAIEIDDPFVPNHKLIRLDRETRVKRVTDTIKALKNISGGAMQTNNMGDVTPKFIVLATTKTGNHPFSHIATNTGAYDEYATLDVDALREVIKDYKEDYVGKIFIGKRAGFMDEKNNDLAKLTEDFKDLIELGTINEAIDRYCAQIAIQMD
ncbi:type I-B CRISPR-associated protein Cas7/Cst2/DevR [Thermophagus xiamenensis]|uniref:CRISPR-associated autoregulator, Cst2 family n=1 Tax=Thermophagus xiamenensis TaxID=385682 RepID=A0A1I2CAX6_9BACT|nr:type I-B CRISPR-associated protein Cas7/Cst2/DevR [Thermophagus xiamenensis]SFE65507.1 CRISPR-associated autoregulator, Cst2 family [Thermophagus xiamenensis]